MSFKQKVWDACNKIPYGKVSTYGQIAKLIKNPKSSRAVGNALNKSPGMPKVACHRVVCQDASVGGFAYGTKKKILLLKQEGIIIKNKKVGKSFFHKF